MITNQPGYVKYNENAGFDIGRTIEMWNQSGSNKMNIWLNFNCFWVTFCILFFCCHFIYFLLLPPNSLSYFSFASTKLSFILFFCFHQKKSIKRKLTAQVNFLKNLKHTKKSGASVFELRFENLSLFRIFLNVCSRFS